ncbi:MAG TPA: hypothetical protein VFY85_14705 [Gemmatimonadaceae bacterium]|nr:hypothetical protein [Gemmatimonadaceae bacterium]
MSPCDPRPRHRSLPLVALAFALLPLGATSLPAQFRPEPGRAIGTVRTEGKLIVLTLDEGALGTASLFDLDHRTLRFTPQGTRYRVERLPLQWDGDFGAPMTGSDATLSRIRFPFSGSRWSAFSVGVTGSITFGDSLAGVRRVAAQSAGDSRNRGGGIAVDRFAELAEAAPGLINTIPAIAVFFKPRMYGTRYLKELPDRAVVTWSLTEPAGGIQDMSWTPTVNRFQAVLHSNGTIDLSYNDVHAQDAIVGVYPMVRDGASHEIASIAAGATPGAAPNLDIRRLRLSSTNGVMLDATIETAGPVLPESDSAAAGIVYRVCVTRTKPTAGCTADADGVVWTIFGTRARGRPAASASRYFASGAGVQPAVTVQGNTISVRGTLPAGYDVGTPLHVSASAQAPGTAAPVDMVAPQPLRLTGVSSAAVDFSSVTRQDGPYAVAYESFHYLKPPRAMDLTCTVIKALGDKFDFLAYYSDFRIDNPEAGTSSTGPLGGGPEGGAVTGIGAEQRNLASFCSKGRFQWQYIQPVYVGANQMAEYPPAGVVDSNRHNILAYEHELRERTSNGKIPPYDYAMSQIGHEMGHRWAAFVSAKVNGEVIPLGPTHWARGLQAQAAFPYQRPVEASAMGGGVWQDNYDGTFTQLDDDYYVPATGWSYLDLYLMGFIAPGEVPDFFILRNLAPAGHDRNGHPVFRADRTKVTVEDVIAVQGPRLPDVEHSQKEFNTGMVVVVEHGRTPSAALMEKTNGIRLRWMDYWTTTTGHRSTMTSEP